MPAAAEKPALPDLVVRCDQGLSMAARAFMLAVPAGARRHGRRILSAEAPLPVYPAGTRLGLEPGGAQLLVHRPSMVPALEADAPALPALRLEALEDFSLPAGRSVLHAHKPGLSLAWIVLSDKGSRGEREDKCGPVILELCRGGMDVGHAQGFIIPDDPPALTALLVHLALEARYDCILTSGGTGVAPRDTAPETTARLLDKRLPGFERAMTNSSLAVTPHGAISRAVAGTLGGALVVNMPGSPKAVRENLAAILPAIPHAIDKLQGDPTDCAQV